MAKSSLVWMMAVRTLVRARPPRSRRLSLSLTVVSDVSAAPMMRSIQPDRSTSCLANRAEPLCKGLPFGRALGVTAIGVRARIAASRRPRRGRRPAAPISSSAVGVVERGGLAGRAERRLTWLDLCSACKGLGKRITVDVDKLLDLDRSVEQGAIRHPAYDIGKWYWREIVQTEVVPPRKSLRRFTAAERERLLWSDDVRIEKVHQGATYERTFEGVARKLERLHVDKGRGSDPARRQGGLSAAVHRAGVPRLRRGSAPTPRRGRWSSGCLREGAKSYVKRFAWPLGVGAWPAVFSGQVDVFPAERRDVGQEFGRDLESGFPPGEDSLAELQRVPVDDDRGSRLRPATR